MAAFVVRPSHTSDQCPTPNGKVRAAVDRAAKEIPGGGQKRSVNVAGLVVYDRLNWIEMFEPNTGIRGS